MDFRLTTDTHDVLTVQMADGDDRAVVSASPTEAAIESLTRALNAAVTDGYGECFWPGFEGGTYWWIFNRTDETVEIIAMWTRGGASLWEHVFRAKDSVAWVRERLAEEIATAGLTGLR